MGSLAGLPALLSGPQVEQDMNKLVQRAEQTIKEHHMLEQGDRVIAALSGGADSVCLFRLLLAVREKMGLKLQAVHVHHGLRGCEADRDAEFVEALCGKYSVPFHIIRVDVRREAKERGMSEEEAGRLLRYEALEREAKAWEQQEEGRMVRIAVAHHSGDQAETILHNLFRGTGLLGLGGIPYERGRIIRPLLDAGRREILAWLEEKGQDFVEDSTNSSADYTRNRIRGTLLPAIESQVNPGAAGNILRMGKLAAMADEYLISQARCWIKDQVIKEEKGFLIPLEGFLPQAPIIQSYVMMELIKQLSGSAKDLGFVHGEQAAALKEKTVGKQVNLPYGIIARRGYEGIYLEKREKKESVSHKALPGLQMQEFSYKKGTQFPKNGYTKWFDCDKIKDTPMVRTRQPGDYLILEDGSRKALRRLMIDEKIPRDLREDVPLLADGDHVMWVIGYRISAYYKVGPKTKRILQASLEEPDGMTGETEDKRNGR